MSCKACSVSGGSRLFSIVIIALLIDAAAFMVFQRREAPVPAAFDPAVSFAEASRSAEASGKPLLVLVTADWCGPCQALKRNALADAEVSALIRERTTPYYLDGTDLQSAPEEAAIAQSLGVRAFPTMVLLQGDTTLGRMSGNASASEVQRWLAESLARGATPAD